MTTYTLAGTCFDVNNAPVDSAVVKVFDTATDTLQGSGTSAADGTYSVSLSIAGPLYAVAYHANAPDIAGTTLDTLMAIGVATSSPTYFLLGF